MIGEMEDTCPVQRVTATPLQLFADINEIEFLILQEVREQDFQVKSYDFKSQWLIQNI